MFCSIGIILMGKLRKYYTNNIGKFVIDIYITLHIADYSDSLAFLLHILVVLFTVFAILQDSLRKRLLMYLQSDQLPL
jgi:hypothetical protein